MADFLVDEQAAPSTPAAGQGLLWLDNVLPGLFVKDDAGRVWGGSSRAAVAAQGAGFATDTYITNSGLLIGSFGLQAQTLFRWTIVGSKTAAGVATPILQVRIGVNQTTADTSRLTLTGPIQTAIADVGTLNVMLTVRTIGAAGVIQGAMWWDHRGTVASSTVGTGFANDATGHADGTSAGFDMTTLPSSYIGLSINGGTSAAWTLTQCQAEAIW